MKNVPRPGRFRQIAFVTTALATLAAASTNVWQDEGHVLVNRSAVTALPSDVPRFFRNATERLAYLGPEPDRWRRVSEQALKASQEPDHFINLEYLPNDYDFPTDRYAYMRDLETRRLAGDTAGDHLRGENIGFLPYISVEIFDRLKAGFRQYRALRAEGTPTELVEGNIILYAGWLGHYVADAAQPNHASVHYNGWKGDHPAGYTGQGIHPRFEGDFVRARLDDFDVRRLLRPARRLSNPKTEYFAYIYESLGLIDDLYRIDHDGGFSGTGTDEGFEFAERRLAAGAQMLADLWYTAWRESED